MKIAFPGLPAIMFLLACQSNLHSQELVFPNEYFIWDNQAPIPPPEDYQDEVWTAGEKSDHALVQYVTHPTLRAFLPEKRAHSGTALIICPGGGYNILVIEREGYEVARRFSEMGIVAFVLKYRHYDRDAAVRDAHQAIRFVRAHADRWGIDPDRVGIGGFSAGGHLSLNAALTEGCDPDFLLLAYPGLTGLDLKPERFRDGFPPIFMINAMDDDVTPVSNLFNLAGMLKNEEIPAEIHIYPGGGHGFDLGNESCNCSGWPELFIQWLAYFQYIDPPPERTDQN